jgi:hypothetical protein
MGNSAQSFEGALAFEDMLMDPSEVEHKRAVWNALMTDLYPKVKYRYAWARNRFQTVSRDAGDVEDMMSAAVARYLHGSGTPDGYMCDVGSVLRRTIGMQASLMPVGPDGQPGPLFYTGTTAPITDFEQQ